MINLIFNTLLQYSCICLPLTIHLLHDIEEINNNHSPQHGRNVIILLGITFSLGVQLEVWSAVHTTWWRYSLYALAVHFAFFNYLLNYYRIPRKSFRYLGNGPWDTFLRTLSFPGQVALQVLVLLAGIGFYYKLSIFA